MANPFEDDLDEEDKDAEKIREGLLCPVCFLDFRTIVELQQHFETGHSNSQASSSQNKQISQQIKGFINKTKKKILKNDFDEEFFDGDQAVSEAGSKGHQSSYVAIWRQQMTLGQTRSHFDHFKKIRDTRAERYVIETNKLLIRLEKLITDAPTDPEKRKAHEKNIVQWVNDVDVKLCPSCAKSFNISRRRHHCRLCGGIMCHNCSQFLEFLFAKKLVPKNLEASDILQVPQTSTLTRRGSNSSLLSMMSLSGDPHIRICHDCKVLLDRREKQIDDKTAKPVLCQMYDRMHQQMQEIQKLVPVYVQMTSSLSLGEMNYNLRDAEELRIKMTRLAESVDSVSRRIANLGTQEGSILPRQLHLQNTIRISATHFLKETMLGLPSLPSQDDLNNLQEQRRQEIQKRIQREKQLALREQIKYSPKAERRHSAPYNASLTNHDSIVSPDTGWNPELNNSKETSPGKNMDPMLLQINIIRNYIKQARQAHKYDEVKMLEDNLKELEIEYMCQNHSDSFHSASS